ncbi:uncharacterized protein LOC132923934 [Rhopalosiphum padi]|uniref:uncharacterized protein LOC132923934 n=1 Tax=Rhopalosiphum padi TaxID=40932 RepID=UPI00298ECFA3|nr:uncharacterized protein LOC132923934 [Rhopalosiphum padi]
MNEIEQTLNKCNSKSPGPDGIPYSFLQNLGTKSKESLLRIYNNIWSTGIIPREWKRGTVIPLPKPGKNKYTTEGYRPITLLNTMAKILEKIINNRLIWFLEKNKHISNKQSGFRRSRSTLDNLVTIHSEINKTFATNQYLGMICLDITKAYDTIWRHRVIHILSKIISNGNMLQYIKSFLDNRQFAVKVSNTLSANLVQENGVPQGSSLSVTLFLLAINNIMENIKYPVNAMLFADDFNFWCRSNNLSTVQRFLEETANKLTQWANTSGFKFSNSKSQCIIFSKKRGPKHINVQIDGKNIPNNNKVKILGLKFDTKMNWIQHLKYLKTDINQRLNLIKVLSHTQWGGDEHSLIRIHRQLIRAKLDYGAILYQSTSHSHLKIIDSTLNSSIRLCIGAFKSSPIESIRNIAQEAPPELRRAEKTLLYAASITRNTDNPANKHIVETIQTANEDKIQLGSILKVNPYSFPPWTFKLEINMELAQNKKENTNPIIYQEHLRKVLEIYQNCNMFFTDASKTEKGVGIAIVHHETTIKYRLPKECSIFSAETIAVFKTIEFIQIQDKMSTNNLILTDSLSTLRSLENNTNPTDIAKNIQEKTYDLKLKGINIIFIWVPGHTNIRGNETADQAAKEAAQPNNLNIQFLDTVTYDDIKTHIKNKSLTKWQTHWSKQQTKLNEIKNTIFNWQNPNLSRKEKILINRLRIGHTRLTHQHLMAKKEPTQCIVCGVTLTVKHIITECYQYAEHLKKYNIPPNLYEALGPDSENTSNMLTFLKKSDLYDKI